MKLFIANVAHELEEAELNQMLTQYGQVTALKLVADPQTGKRKDFGFIEMRDRAQAQKAIDALNGLEIHGRTISLKETNPGKETPAAQEQLQHHRTPRQRINNNNSIETDGNR